MDEWLQLFARANFLRSTDTAHDLKTPLNIAVLNLELLRMRIRKMTGADDEKLNEYTRALEMELRRMARIFDTFFLLSTPPRSEGAPAPIDLGPLVSHAAGAALAEDATVEVPSGMKGMAARPRPSAATPARIQRMFMVRLP